MKREGGCVIAVPSHVDITLVAGSGSYFHTVKGLFVQCPDHPTYRALRKPTSRCAYCKMMYVERVR